MKKEASENTTVTLHEVVIPKENAVFWMDGQGRWRNRHGRFEHKRIIDYFNRAIRHDKDGYYVTQVRGNIREKVYFPYDDTALFVFQILAGEPLHLILNTGETLPLDPTQLFVRADQLYQRRGEEVIKFSQRALMDLSPYLEETAGALMIRSGERALPIANEKNE